MSSKADKYIANIRIEQIYQRDGSAGATLRTDMASLSDKELRPILDPFKRDIAKRLGVSGDSFDPSGMYDGIDYGTNTINIRPYTKKVSAGSLREAIEAEVNEAKARLQTHAVANPQIVHTPGETDPQSQSPGVKAPRGSVQELNN